MAYFVVKITENGSGKVRSPMVANADNDSNACEIVKYLANGRDTIAAREIREDVALACFGAIPSGGALTCWNWIWEDDGDNIKITI